MANPRSHFSDKSLLRDAMRKRLRTLSQSERRERSLQICENLSTMLSGKNSIALFAPIEVEPDLDLLWELGWHEQHVVSYPNCDGRNLRFRTVSALSDLSPGKFGIRQPIAGGSPETLDLIVVPGLAFTSDGHRLGRGAGFYDRFLSTLPGYTVKVGVCFAFQLLPEIPHVDHDVKMDALVYA
ncbi:MAG: 5-formyltetrahydrofolate cyclo-ligase [Verrucomicrobia bacterium]|nr:5-formyltetrahydrofolate cyclo-ligase [Verrucomicrobiota bacterium]